MTKVVLAKTIGTDLALAFGKTNQELPYRESTDKIPLLKATEQLAARPDSSEFNSSKFSLSEFNLSGPSCQSSATDHMSVCGLNHFNITAHSELIEQVKHFYTAVIGLKLGPRAHLANDGYWLYAGRTPIVHLSVRPGIAALPSSQKGHFNHISLGCVGLKRAIAKMIATQTPYRLIQLPDICQTQLFVTDPAGIGVELTFFNESL